MRITGWDLECSSLSGMIGRVLCCSFIPIRHGDKGKPYTFRGDDRRFRNPKDIVDDSKLVIAIRDELEKSDLIVAHNGKLFDRKAMDEVVHHCEQDCKVLEDAYWRLLPFMREVRKA